MEWARTDTDTDTHHIPANAGSYKGRGGRGLSPQNGIGTKDINKNIANSRPPAQTIGAFGRQCAKRLLSLCFGGNDSCGLPASSLGGLVSAYRGTILVSSVWLYAPICLDSSWQLSPPISTASVGRWLPSRQSQLFPDSLLQPALSSEAKKPSLLLVRCHRCVACFRASSEAFFAVFV